VKWAALSLLVFVAAACSDAANTQFLPVGSRCSSDTQCGTAPYRCIADNHPFGYCDKPCKVDSECPADSLCATAAGACRRKCTVATDCRVSEGYSCQSLATSTVCDTAPTP
jgi:hypothetical protein